MPASMCEARLYRAENVLSGHGIGMKTTPYFNSSVMSRRPYLRQEWIEYVLKDAVRVEVQGNGRIRRWALISEVGKYLRVVTEPDGETVHNAFFDRRFKP